jgi:hypothetical protein
MDTLALDNYVYLGLHVFKCRENDSQQRAAFNVKGDFPFEDPKKAAFSPTFLNELRTTHSQGKNAIIMAEGFWSYTREQRKSVVDEFSSNWNVKLILNYRRAYEFLPSAYNQNHKPSTHPTDVSSTLWPGETNEYGVVGKPLLPFNIDEDYVMKKYVEGMETKGMHPVSQFASNLNLSSPSTQLTCFIIFKVEIMRQKYPFPNVTIIKLHELEHTSGDAVLQEMFCHVVNNMPNSCAAAQLDDTIKIGDLASNPYYSFNYDMLATAAYEKQLFGFQKKNAISTQELLPSRHHITALIQRYQEDTLNLTHQDFAAICMAKEKMDRILNASIISEKVIYGSDWRSQQEVNLRQAFLAYQEKRQYVFCWINTEKTLQDPTWLAFFDSI